MEGIVLLALLLTSGWLWLQIAARRRRGRTAVEYQPRRPVPWHGIEVLGLLMLHILALLSVPMLWMRWAGISPRDLAADPRPPDTMHAVGRLLRDFDHPGVVALCVLSVVVITPVAEELVYRLLLQGWLERVEPLLRRQVQGLRHLVRGTGPVLASSTFFAWMHAHGAEPQASAEVLLCLIGGTTVANTLMVAVLVGVLRFRARATLADLGIVPGQIGADLRLGLAAFLAAAGPVYLVQWLAALVIPADVSPDPLGILVLALVLGYLYFRTHRILPSIVVHMALNATSIALFLLAK